MVTGLPQINHVDQVCDSCLTRKQKRATFPSVVKYRALERLELVHGDLCGPVMPATPGGKCYFLLLVNDMSRFMWLVLLAMKDEAFTTFTAFKARVKAEKDRKIGTLCTNQGGEFMARGFTEYCSEHGMQRHLTVLYTSEQNGIVERRNQPVLGMACSMLKAMSMPNWFWGRL
jgi:transposase InsO family protein